FLLGIQTQRLKNVVITEELISEVEKGMTDSSNWLHDAGAGLNPTPPDIQKAEKDIKLFEEFCSKCSPA
ncbi:MAG: hypothetical protein NTU73_04640, partial [Ignavibacteriae bacterium]|nr:hypothetical protein [Ignavibacteriota bacterium]